MSDCFFARLGRIWVPNPLRPTNLPESTNMAADAKGGLSWAKTLLLFIALFLSSKERFYIAAAPRYMQDEDVLAFDGK